MARLRQGRLDEAEVRFRAALRERPRYASPYFGLGTTALARDDHALAATGRRDPIQLRAACDAFGRCLAASPGHGPAVLGLAACESRRAEIAAAAGDTAEARRLLIAARGRLASVVAFDPALRVGGETARALLAGVDGALAALPPAEAP
jgi:hypothetical protein